MTTDRMEKIMIKLARYFEDNWSVGVLDNTKGCWKLKPENASPSYLRAQTALHRHILIKPEFPLDARCLLVDDINRSQLCEQHQDKNGHWLPGRLVVETSPTNYQVWVRCLTKMSILEKRLYLHHFHSDPGAAPKGRWGRCPGFHNTKAKYMTCKGFPLAKLIWIDWKEDAVLPALDLFHSSLETVQKNYSNAAKLRQSQGAVCQSAKEPSYLNRPICRQNYARADQSAADFAYALALVRRNVPDDEIRSRIQSERQDWAHHQGEKRLNDYLDRTVRKARSLLEF